MPRGPAPRVAAGKSLLSLEPGELLLSALKPAGDGDGWVLRVENPGSEDAEARIELGFEVREASLCRLDEEEDGAADAVALEDGGRVLRFAVAARALRSLRLR